ncbi:MAG: YebC/PmpR family DNA-binding transcriptional regulator [Pseudomonadota bacterium]|nr:YebC/PmpR family DNA-binding transcriptional regulator [Pseudomonadota bacterium]
MGAQWKKSAKSEASQKKGLVFTKVAREIQVAAKLGGPDIAGNHRLARAISAAKAISCPNDTIDRAIKKGSGQLGDAQIDEIMYEGFGPHQVGLLVDCQTDNRVRTASEIRLLFKSHGGNLGEMGSVAWMFDRVGLIEAAPPKDMQKNMDYAETEALEAGANDVEKSDGENYYFYGAIEELENIRAALNTRGWKVVSSELSYKAKNLTEISPKERQEVEAFLQAVDEYDDTHKIYTSASFI